MRAQQIKQSALTQFVEKGFESTALSDIVDEIGIKKQSIYSHFKNKEDVFLEVMNDVINEEISFLKGFFEEHIQFDLEEVLFHLLIIYKKRYLEQEGLNIKFMLRMAFMPPIHLRNVVADQYNFYYSELEKLVEKVFLKADNIHVSAEEGMISYLNFLDGILVELIYSDIEKFERRLTISWNVYWRGISI